MKKLISSLTALTLSIVSSVPMISNAIAPSPNYKGNFTIDDVVSYVFGEKAIVKYEYGVYFVMSPQAFGSVSFFYPEIIVKLKKSSEFDEESLNQLVWQNCTPYLKCRKSDSDDNTYVFHENSNFLEYGKGLNGFNEELCPLLAEFLSQYDDVVSISKNNIFGVDKTNIINFAVGVSKDVDFDYDKYSDYLIYDCYPFVGFDDEEFAVMSKLADYYYYDDDETGIMNYSVPKDGYYEDMYNAYLNLQKDYGEENVVMQYSVLESAPQKQTLGENLYTALISGDTNADGEVNISDVLSITAYVGDSEKNQLNETALINADINGDGAVTANDALTIQQYLANVITEL